jgi:hypothetical protein
MNTAAAGAGAGAGINVLALGVGLTVPGKSPVSSLDFHGQGQYLVSGAEDGQSIFSQSMYYIIGGGCWECGEGGFGATTGQV